MKKRLFSLLLALALLVPRIPSASVFAEGEVPCADPDLVFYGTSLTLENNIAINFVVDAAAFADNGFSDPQVKFEFCGSSVETSDYITRDGLYYFTFRDLTATHMGEEVTATLSAVKGGARVSGAPVSESVASYCVRALGDAKVSRYPALCTLIADLLTFGAKSQLYFGYDAEHLATNVLTADQLNCGTKTDPVPVSCRNVSYVRRPGAELFWKNANLKLSDSIDLQFFFDTADLNGVRIELRDGTDALVASFREEDVDTADGYYRVCCDTLTPDRMGDELFLTAYRGSEAISNTLRYSVESYAVDAQARYGGDTALKDLLFAMLNYGASAKEYVSEGPLGQEAPTTREMLDAIPTANASMTEEELRQIVLDYYALQSSILWVPSAELRYWNHPTSVSQTVLPTNHLYSGMPYTSATSCIQHFLDFYDEETGVFTNPYGEEMGTYLGNSCSSSVYWAWGRISTTEDFKDTRTMTPTAAHGLVKVGDYTIGGSSARQTTIANFASTSTFDICTENGIDGMSRAYAMLRPGDGLVTFKTDVSNHAMMATKVKVVYTDGTSVYDPETLDPDKTIDPEKSYVNLYEQNSPLLTRTLSDGQKATDLGDLAKQRRFVTLFNDGYIPVTCLELAHEDAFRETVQDAAAGISGTPSDAYNVTEKGFGARMVTSNYAIARVLVTISDRTTGNVVTTVVEHVRGITREYGLNDIRIQLYETLALGTTYNARVDLDLSNGEALTAWEGRLKMPAA